MRAEFEKLPEIAANLHNVVFDKGSNEYLPKKMGYVIHEFSAYYLNGAWYAFQEQQKKIARLQSALDELKEWAQDEKQKSLDSDLSEYNNAKYVMAALFVENINRITGTEE